MVRCACGGRWSPSPTAPSPPSVTSSSCSTAGDASCPTTSSPSPCDGGGLNADRVNQLLGWRCPRGRPPLFNDGGSIFMTGSNASLRGYPNWSVYAGSKAVLPAYARVWVSELRDRKIRGNALTPGQVASPMLADVMDAETKAQFASVVPRRG